MSLLEIKNLHVAAAGKEILHGVDMEVGAGQVHVLMGPNGAGKSTLLNAIMASPVYQMTQGEILYKGESLKGKTADQRAREGIFMSFQNPFEVPGLTLEDFLRTVKSQKEGKQVPVLQFKKELAKLLTSMGLPGDYGDRYLNVGFSGGEKKKAEIVQMRVMDPDFILLDETDSGLDVDAVRTVSQGIRDFLQGGNKSCLIITHNTAILEALQPDTVHVMAQGRLVKTGGPDLLPKIQEEGYGWILQEAGLDAGQEDDHGED